MGRVPLSHRSSEGLEVQEITSDVVVGMESPELHLPVDTPTPLRRLDLYSAALLAFNAALGLNHVLQNPPQSCAAVVQASIEQDY